MVQRIAEVKGWPVEEADWADSVSEEEWGVVRRLERNWTLFREGRHVVPETGKKGKKKGREPTQ